MRRHSCITGLLQSTTLPNVCNDIWLSVVQCLSMSSRQPHSQRCHDPHCFLCRFMATRDCMQALEKADSRFNLERKQALVMRKHDHILWLGYATTPIVFGIANTRLPGLKQIWRKRDNAKMANSRISYKSRKTSYEEFQNKY